MSFDQQLGKFANSPFPTYQCQASINETSENNARLASSFIPSVTEQDTASYNLWNPADNTDCEGETDLHDLVSNILDESEPQDSYHDEGTKAKIKPAWSPNTLNKGFQQYFQSEEKTENSATFSPNCTYYKSFSKDVEELSQQINGFPTTQPLLFNWLNGDVDSYTSPKKLPPGLPLPHLGNTTLSQMEQSKHDYISADKDRETRQPVSNFPSLSNVLAPQSEMSSPCFDPYYAHNSIQSNMKPISNEQNVPQDVSQLVSTFQSVLAGEQNFLSPRESANMHKQTDEMHQEGNMAEQWKFSSPLMSIQSAPTIPIQKQQVGEFVPVHLARNGVVRKLCKNDGFQDLPAFSPQNVEYFQQPNQLSVSFNFANQYQNKLAKLRRNTSFPTNLSMTQYFQHHSQQGQMQNRIKQPRANCGPCHTSNFLSQSASDFVQQHAHEMQRGTLCLQDYTSGAAAIHCQPGQEQVERSLDSMRSRDGDSDMQVGKNRMHMAGYLGEGISTRPFTNSLMGEGEKKQALYQNPYFGLSGSMHRSNSQKFVPLVHPLKDPRSHSYLPSNSSNFRSRAKLPYFPSKDLTDMKSANKTFNSCLSDMMSCRGESVYHDMASAKITPRVNNQEGSMFQLFLNLEDCFEQWRHLEEERRKVEIILIKTFPRKWNAAMPRPNLPKIPPKPTKLDQLLINQMREQAKVASLLGGMEHLRSIPFHCNIHSAANMHHEAICITQARHKEISNMSNYQRQRRPHFRENKETLLLAAALKDLSAATKKMCTTLWCALQMTLPKPVQKQDHCVTREATCEERYSRAFEEYTFILLI
ncbi:hypothetical protein LDENG_00033540 [Lucifuga dentata]|nr:hypothetical protein LDENG_00033540 [Lucifuga dentata]